MQLLAMFYPYDSKTKKIITGGTNTHFHEKVNNFFEKYSSKGSLTAISQEMHQEWAQICADIKKDVLPESQESELKASSVDIIAVLKKMTGIIDKDEKNTEYNNKYGNESASKEDLIAVLKKIAQNCRTKDVAFSFDNFDEICCTITDKNDSNNLFKFKISLTGKHMELKYSGTNNNLPVIFNENSPEIHQLLPLLMYSKESSLPNEKKFLDAIKTPFAGFYIDKDRSWITKCLIEVLFSITKETDSSKKKCYDELLKFFQKCYGFREGSFYCDTFFVKHSPDKNKLRKIFEEDKKIKEGYKSYAPMISKFLNEVIIWSLNNKSNPYFLKEIPIEFLSSEVIFGCMENGNAEVLPVFIEYVKKVVHEEFKKAIEILCEVRGKKITIFHVFATQENGAKKMESLINALESLKNGEEILAKAFKTKCTMKDSTFLHMAALFASIEAFADVIEVINKPKYKALLAEILVELDKYGYTPLHYATYFCCGNTENQKKLIATLKTLDKEILKKALNTKSKEERGGLTPIGLAKKQEMHDLVKTLEGMFS